MTRKRIGTEEERQDQPGRQRLQIGGDGAQRKRHGPPFRLGGGDHGCAFGNGSLVGSLARVHRLPTSARGHNGGGAGLCEWRDRATSSTHTLPLCGERAGEGAESPIPSADQAAMNSFQRRDHVAVFVHHRVPAGDVAHALEERARRHTRAAAFSITVPSGRQDVAWAAFALDPEAPLVFRTYTPWPSPWRPTSSLAVEASRRPSPRCYQLIYS